MQEALLRIEISKLTSFLESYTRDRNSRAYKMLEENLLRKNRFLKKSMYSDAAIALFNL